MLIILITIIALCSVAAYSLYQMVRIAARQKREFEAGYERLVRNRKS